MTVLIRSSFVLAIIAFSALSQIAAADHWHKLDPPLVATKTDIAVSGHGRMTIDRRHRETTVPKGLEFWVLAPPAATISDSLGRAIKNGEHIKAIGIVSEKTGSVSPVKPRVYKAGEKVPNFALSPPEGLELGGGGPYILKVSHKTSLRSLWKRIEHASKKYNHANEAKVVRVFWLACTAVDKAKNQVVIRKK